MKFSRMIIGLSLLVTAALAGAQAWSDSYGKALAAIRDQKWEDARGFFKEAIASRADDQSDATRLPGSITERRTWRNGAPYSPNFGAAYAGLKAAQALTDEASRNSLTAQVAAEFEAVLAKNQHSQEAYYFLAMAYSNLRDVAKQQDLEARYKVANGKFGWKVDGDIITPEDKTAINALVGGSSSSGSTTIRPGGTTPVSPTAKLQDKFAFLIGNSQSRMADMSVPFASNDVMMLRESLIQFAGYDERNVDTSINATAAQIKAAAEAFAERVTPEGTVFLFFSGVGANLDGKDFFAGVDTAKLTDSASMIAKNDIFQLFVKKGCKVFAFFQTPRPINSGFYFGKEEPRFGLISQTQATLPGGALTSVIRSGQSTGLFADAMCSVIKEFHSNNIPIHEFGWQVFYYMRGARTPGGAGSGGTQQMTLPVVINMDPERSGF